MKKLVIIPTYNEKENIRDIISAIFSLGQDFHILVVDDSSPDGTAEIVKTLQNEFPAHLHLSVRKAKNGLGNRVELIQLFAQIAGMAGEDSNTSNSKPATEITTEQELANRIYKDM